MKLFKSKLIALLISLTFLTNSAIPVLANNNMEYSQKSDIKVVDNGIYINDKFYTINEFETLLENSIQISDSQPMGRSAAVGLIAGTWYIPGVGQVVITAVGAVIVAGSAVAVGSWVYNKVVDYFSTKKEIEDAKDKIPSRLKDNNGEVDLGKFDQKVNGKTAYKEKGGWTIEKDNAGHKGSKWKLKDKSGKRVASLDANGRVVGK